MQFRTSKWRFWSAKKRTVGCDLVLLIGKWSSWALLLQKGRYDRKDFQKASFVLCLSITSEVLRWHQFLTAWCSYATVRSLWQYLPQKYPNRGMGRAGPFHGLFPPRIWRRWLHFMEMFEIYSILWASQNNLRSDTTKSNQEVTTLDKYTLNWSTKHVNLFMLCIERSSSPFQTSSKL